MMPAKAVETTSPKSTLYHHIATKRPRDSMALEAFASLGQITPTEKDSRILMGTGTARAMFVNADKPYTKDSNGKVTVDRKYLPPLEGEIYRHGDQYEYAMKAILEIKRALRVPDKTKTAELGDIIMKRGLDDDMVLYDSIIFDTVIFDQVLPGRIMRMFENLLIRYKPVGMPTPMLVGWGQVNGSGVTAPGRVIEYDKLEFIMQPSYKWEHGDYNWNGAYLDLLAAALDLFAKSVQDDLWGRLTGTERRMAFRALARQLLESYKGEGNEVNRTLGVNLGDKTPEILQTLLRFFASGYISLDQHYLLSDRDAVKSLTLLALVWVSVADKISAPVIDISFELGGSSRNWPLAHAVIEEVFNAPYDLGGTTKHWMQPYGDIHSINFKNVIPYPVDLANIKPLKIARLQTRSLPVGEASFRNFTVQLPGTEGGDENDKYLYTHLHVERDQLIAELPGLFERYYAIRVQKYPVRPDARKYSLMALIADGPDKPGACIPLEPIPGASPYIISKRAGKTFRREDSGLGTRPESWGESSAMVHLGGSP
jgi:hypothetical protein